VHPAKPENQGTAEGSAPLSREGFAEQFSASFRAFWLVAAGVLGSRSHADDVVQEAGLIALSKLDQFPAGGNFPAWMSAIVRHVALNTARKEHRRRTSRIDGEAGEPAAPPDAPPPDAGRVSPSGRLPGDQEFFDDRIMHALSSMSEIARTCLLLRTIEDLEYSEISRLLEIPENTAMSHVHRARQYLRQRLADGSAPGVNKNPA